jgi:gliding motility-associated-like protein
MIRFLLLLFCFLYQFPGSGLIKATHIIGGEIYYDCLGNNQFRITLKLYRDCLNGQAPYDDPANVGIYNASGAIVQNVELPYPGSHLIPPQSLNPCFQANANICVEECIYTKVISLPYSPGGYSLVYQRCCRNQSILNLNNPGDTGATYVAHIPESAWTDCNSSPRCNQFPPIVLCINDALNFDHSATDPDGDVLVYSLCDPFEGATPDAPMPIPPSGPPFNFVSFSNPYSAVNPLPSNPQASVDPNTGVLSVFPTQLGQYVVAVCVSEYRNGVLLSVNKRDFQFNVVSCGNFTNAEFEAPLADINLGNSICNGLQASFINQSTNASNYIWDFGVPGINTDVSNLSNPVYSYPDSGQYTVLLIANPGYSCADTATLEIAVYRKIEAIIPEQAPQCITTNSFSFEAQGQYEANATFLWEFFGPASVATSTQQNPTNISWTEPGIWPVYLTITDPHCEDHDTILVTVYALLSVDFTVNNQDACEPADLVFQNLSQYSPGALFYWDFGDGTHSTLANPTHNYTEPGIYDLSLQVENIVGCTDTVLTEYPAFIRIRPRPNAGIDADPLEASILSPQITFSDLSTEYSGTWLDPGNGDIQDDPNTTYTYADSGWYRAEVIAVNEQGCYDTAFIKVRINPIFTCYIPNAFSPDGDGINETFSPKGEGFKSYHFVIFDRWGDEIFQTFSYDDVWDGRANKGRRIAATGVYNYKLWIKDVFNTEHVYTGMVVLVR